MKVLMVLMCLGLVACQKIEKQFSDRMVVKIDNDVKRDDITGRMHMLLRGLDDQNWKDVSEVFAPKVELDVGEGSSVKTREEVVAAWKKETAGLDGIQHVVSNYGIEVDDKHARLMFNGITTQYKKTKSGRNTRISHGSYVVEMELPDGTPDNWAWIITKFKYVNKFSDGNLELK